MFDKYCPMSSLLVELSVYLNLTLNTKISINIIPLTEASLDQNNSHKKFRILQRLMGMIQHWTKIQIWMKLEREKFQLKFIYKVTKISLTIISMKLTQYDYNNYNLAHVLSSNDDI